MGFDSTVTQCMQTPCYTFLERVSCISDRKNPIRLFFYYYFILFLFIFKRFVSMYEICV